MKELLELRKSMKAKRPAFVRSNSHKLKRIPSAWRAPRGLQNKEKLGKHGKRPVVNIGYRSPAAVRGLSSSGRIPVLVSNLAQLSVIDPKKQCVIISSVGTKNRLKLLGECKAKNLEVVNWKIDDQLVKIKEMLEQRAAKKKASAAKKEKKKPKVEKKTEVKEEETEDQKEAERKEMEKVLTRRE